MATTSFSGNTQIAGVGAVTATCSLWATSRTWPGGQPPAQGASPPTGSPDAGPVTSGTSSGGPGAFLFTSVAEGDYLLEVVYGGVNYWSGPYSLVEQTDVVHITGTETISGAKTFTGAAVLGKGTLVTTQTGGGATQNTLDDGSGNTITAGTAKFNSSSTTIPNVWFGVVASGALNLGTNYGIDLDANSALALNAKSGATGGVYTMRSGTKSVTLDDGSGNTSTGALNVSGTFTYTGGTMNLPNGVIPYAALIGGAVSGAAVDIGSTQTITGAKTFAGDVGLTGSQLNGAAIGTPSTPVVTPQGTTGTTTYQYRWVATTYDGRDSLPSATGQTTTGNAALSVGNYNLVTGSTVTGAGSYTLLRWNGSVWQKLVGGLTAPNYSDNGSATPTTYTAATINPGGEISATSVAVNRNSGGITAARCLGTTSGAAPTGGPYLTGDYVYDLTFRGTWICTVAGSPGTWKLFGAGIAARMYASTQTVCTSGATTQITGLAQDYAYGGASVSSNFIYLPGVAGIYSVSAQICFQVAGGNAPAGDYVWLLYVNGAEVRRARTYLASPDQLTILIADDINLPAGAGLYIQVYQVTGGGVASNTGAGNTWLAVSYKGPA